jgi:hypothetical protein
VLAGIHGELCAEVRGAGVRLVGGCCGTTPDHIRVMKAALRVGEARRPDRGRTTSTTQPAPPPIASRAAGETLAIGREARRGEFATMVEIVLPKESTSARRLKAPGS